MLKKIVIRNGKKQSHNKISSNYLGSPSQVVLNQEDHNIQTYSLFCLVALAVKNYTETLLPVAHRNQVVSFFFPTNEQKRKKI